MADKSAPKTEAKKAAAASTAAETPKTEAKAAASPAAASAPATSGATTATAAGPDEKEVCRAWRNNGECRFGERCKYVHSEGEPIAPPPRDYTPRGECHNYRDSKTCRFAERCRFQHGEEDKRTTYRPERKKEDGAAAGSEETGEKQICRNYQRKGKCRFGEKCHHIHVAGEKKEPAPEAKKAPKKSQPAAKKAAPKKEAKDAGAGGDEPKKKRRRPRKSRSDAGEKITLTEENKYDGEGIELCRNFRNKGKCRFGDDCTFSHAPGGPIGQPAGERPARAAPAAGAGGAAARVPGLCYNFRDDGECEFGDECRFKHGDADTRDFSRRAPRKAAGNVGVCYQFQETGECEYGSECRFSHDAATA